LIPTTIRGITVGVFQNDEIQKSAIHNWNISNNFEAQKNSPGGGPGNVAAHEFGHYLGNVEDYGSQAEVSYPGQNGPFPGSQKMPGEGPSVMGSELCGRRASSRTPFVAGSQRN
jgi:hypothetical protein